MPRRGKPNPTAVEWAWRKMRAGNLTPARIPAIFPEDCDFLTFGKGMTVYHMPVGYFISIIPISKQWFLGKGYKLDHA